MIQNKNEQKNLKNTGESLKNQLICGIMNLTKEEREELLALWKEMKHYGVQRPHDLCQPEYGEQNRL